MIRNPNFEHDGWQLESGEARNAEHPDRFEIPSATDRAGLTVGDSAQLLFQIGFDDPEDPVNVERMWVYVTEVADAGYFGVLVNTPRLIPENESLWVGVELPFRAEHVISWIAGDGSALPVQQKTNWPRA